MLSSPFCSVTNFNKKINKEIKLVEDQTWLWKEMLKHTQKSPVRNKNPDVSKKQDFHIFFISEPFEHFVLIATFQFTSQLFYFTKKKKKWIEKILPNWNITTFSPLKRY